MEVYDGKLYVAPTMQQSLECFGQFVNGNLLRRTPSEWKDQWNYLKALMKALATVDPNGTGNPDTLAQTIKFSYNFVFKNITVRNMASAIKLLNYLRTAKRGFDLYVTEMASTLRPLPLMALGTLQPWSACVCHHRPGPVPGDRQPLLWHPDLDPAQG